MQHSSQPGLPPSDSFGPDVASDASHATGLVSTTSAAQRTHLRLPDDLSLPDWCDIGSRLMTVSDSSAWWIGDWLVYGRSKYPDRYQRAMAETSLDYQTLRNYAWVARVFEPRRRRPELTFQHHMEVAALPLDEQDHWLDFAARLRWSRNELRRQIRASTEDGYRATRVRGVSVHLDLSKDRYELWSKAAEDDNIALHEWIVGVLDHASRLRKRLPRQRSGPPAP